MAWVHIPVGAYTATRDNNTHCNRRQPMFKGLREDKAPEECMEKSLS